MPTTITFTANELAVVETALFDYQMETETYLQSYKKGWQSGHDDCCETARARSLDRDEQRASLETRLALINSALEQVLRNEKI